MKTKQSLLVTCFPTAIVLFALAGNLHAQSWSINGNANIAAGTNYLGTSDPNDLVFRTNAIERGRVFGTGDWRLGTAANNVSIDVNGKLRFNGTAVYQVGGNKYAFQYTGNPNYGLFFNSSAIQYEFRNSTAAPVFLVNANTGAGNFSGALTVGAYTLPSTDGNNNQVLKTNGAGTLTWQADNNTTYTAGSGLSLVGTTFNNTAPDQTITIAGSNGITTSGTYPNFTINGANLWRITGNAGTSPGTNFIGTTDAQPLVFRTSNTEKVRILTDGKVGIGTTIPTARLHINGTSGEDALRIQTNGTTRLFVDDAGGVSIGSLTAGPAGGLYVNGSVGIGVTVPTSRLQVAGDISTTTDGGGLLFAGNQYIRDAAGAGFSALEIHADFVPDNTNSHSLGSSTNEWTEVWAVDGTINLTSTKNTTNVKTLPYGINEIMKMRPVFYNRNKNPEGGSGITRIGLIAEDLKKVVPEAVKDWSYVEDQATKKLTKVPISDIGVNMNSIIPVLINGMQEQQQIIDAQNKKIEALIEKVNQLIGDKSANNQSVTSNFENRNVMATQLSSATLEQNIPNPLTHTTVIRYTLPQKFTAAQIIIRDSNGKTIKQLTVSGSGQGMITVDASTLTAGAYNYTLMIDGKQIDTKTMLIVR